MKLLPILIFTFAAIQSAVATPTATPIRIGWTGPLTGTCAVVGVDSVPSIQLVFDRVNRAGGVNGHPLELIVEDDGYDTARAVTAYKKLVSLDKVSVVIASTYGGVFATAQDAVRDNVLVIDPLDCNDQIAALPENTLCLATRTESIAAAFAGHIQQKSYRSVMIFMEESDGWMQFLAQSTVQALQAAGTKVQIEASLPSTSDYRSMLMRAKKSRVDAMIFLGNDQMGLALRQARELGITASFYGIGSMLSPGFQALAAGALDSAFVSSWEAPRGQRYEEYVHNFIARTGRKPALELASVPAYDVATILVGCLSESIGSAPESTVNIASLRNCLYRTRDFSGLSGTINVDADGAVRSIHEKLYQMRSGKLRTLP